MQWVNFGGGHHITRPGYDLERLVRILAQFRARHPHLTVYLEPGEAVVLNAGSLFGTVLDIVRNDGEIAILDVSAEAHMPDVIEMPYTPPVQGAAEPGVHPCEYRLAGHSCLAGDVIGDYSFPAPLKVGDRVEFLDMALYTMVKTNTFNGLALPSIATFDPDNGEFKLIKTFGYEDFKSRLS
jgi:carboxynorspermidine decarboxylase